MYSKDLLGLIAGELESLEVNGKYKHESALEGPQGPSVTVGGKEVLMFAANNYLGLASHPEVISAAKNAMDAYGYGMASVRFISGTSTLHQALEKKIAQFLEMEDALLFGSCYAANEAFFSAIIQQTEASGRKSVIYSDELNHASIIDGLKLVKKELVQKRICPHNDLGALEAMMEEDKAQDYFLKIIVTDGVFSMEGELAKLPELADIADKNGALLFVDDSHAVGVCGARGKGSIEELGVMGRVDVVSGTLGKALGGAEGGYIAGKKELIDFLRQKARPYIFSNSLPPMIVAGTLKAIELLEKNPELLKMSKENTTYFRREIVARGFNIIEGSHPIVPILIGEAAVTQKMQKALLAKGLYLVGLWFPVVAEGQARLRVQISSAHTREQLDKAIEIITGAGKELGIVQ